MTVQTTTSRADYTGNGVTTAFTVPFYFLDNTHIKVLRTQISTGVVTTLALTTDYTMAGAGVSSGGTLTALVAPTSDQKLSILRNVPLTQLVHYVPNDPFPAATHEQALDQLTMEVQQLSEGASRALTLPANTTGVSTALPTPTANKLLGWNSTALALQNVDPSTLSSLVAYGSTSSQTYSGNASTKAFVLSSAGAAVNNVQMYISGVRQTPGTDYTLGADGLTITFVTAPPTGTNNVLAVWQQALAIGTVDSGAVSYSDTGIYGANSVGYRLKQLVSSIGASLIGFIQSGTGAVQRTAQDKMRESVSVKDFGAVGDGVTDDTAAIRACIEYVNSLPQVPSKPYIFVPAGRYLITSTLQLYANISIRGVPRDVGYSYGFTHSSELIAGSAMGAMLDVTGSNIYVGDLGFYGNSSATYGLYSAGVFGRTSSNTFERLAITLCTISGMYLNNMGLTKINNVQISNCNNCGMDLSGFGDADIDGCYINTNNYSSTVTTATPSSAAVTGAGIRIRADVATGAQSANINIRGGKIEFNKVGVLINAGQGINIQGVNFDSNPQASIYIYSDNITAYPTITTKNLLTCTSIQITGCRFVGGTFSAAFSPNSHIFAAFSRYVTIVGNGFKRSGAGAVDFDASSSQGPSYGIYLYNAEECTVVGNDLYGAAITNCLRVEHATPANAQHSVLGNNLDGTEVVNPNTIKTFPSFGSINFASNMTPNAKNTAKAWVRFNGNGGAPVIIDSFNVASVTGAGGTYTVTATSNWGVNASASVSVRNWFAASDTGLYGAITASTVVVYSTTAGVLSGNGDITVIIFGA